MPLNRYNAEAIYHSFLSPYKRLVFVPMSILREVTECLDILFAMILAGTGNRLAASSPDQLLPNFMRS